MLFPSLQLLAAADFSSALDVIVELRKLMVGMATTGPSAFLLHCAALPSLQSTMLLCISIASLIINIMCHLCCTTLHTVKFVPLCAALYCCVLCSLPSLPLYLQLEGELSGMHCFRQVGEQLSTATEAVNR